MCLAASETNLRESDEGLVGKRRREYNEKEGNVVGATLKGGLLYLWEGLAESSESTESY